MRCGRNYIVIQVIIVVLFCIVCAIVVSRTSKERATDVDNPLMSALIAIDEDVAPVETEDISELKAEDVAPVKTEDISELKDEAPTPAKESYSVPAPTVEIVSTPILSDSDLRYGFTDDDVYLLAQLLCGDKSKDGDGEYDIDFQSPDSINHNEVSKVLCVLMNRVRDDRFPDTVKDVILAPNQFSVMPKNLYSTPSDIALEQTRTWCEAYDRNDSVQVVPEDHVFFSGDGYTNTTRS